MKGITFYSILFGICLVARAQVTVELLPLNTKEYDEFSPGFFGSGLAFCSNASRSSLIAYADTTGKNNTQSDIYIVSAENAFRSKPKLFSDKLTSNLHEGPFSISADKKYMFFTRNQILSGNMGNVKAPNNYLGIFTSARSGDLWLEPKAFPYNSNQYNVIHPALHPGGQMLVFASNMPGGFGGYDLYICFKKNTTWTKPENMGPNINSVEDEAFPFISGSNKLFYASRGKQSMGGFDIYESQMMSDSWTPSKNVGETYNSVKDDFGYVINDMMDTGYFASNRNGSDDIYIFYSKHDQFSDCKEFAPIEYCYEFFEETNSQDLNSSMKFEWDLGDGTKIRSLKAEHCYQKPGTYHVVLNVIDSLTKEVYFSQAEYDFTADKPEQAYFNIKGELLHKKTLVFDASEAVYDDYQITQFKWDFGDGKNGTGMKINHVYQKPGDYYVKISLQMSHKQKLRERRECYYKKITIR